MTWAQRLKRVFNIDIESCQTCGGAVKVVACIGDPVVIEKILDHQKHKAEANVSGPLPESRSIGGGRPDGRCQSEKSAGEQASLGSGSWNSGQGHAKGPVRRLPGDPDGRGMPV